MWVPSFTSNRTSHWLPTTELVATRLLGPPFLFVVCDDSNSLFSSPSHEPELNVKIQHAQYQLQDIGIHVRNYVYQQLLYACSFQSASSWIYKTTFLQAYCTPCFEGIRFTWCSMIISNNTCAIWFKTDFTEHWKRSDLWNSLNSELLVNLCVEILRLHNWGKGLYHIIPPFNLFKGKHLKSLLDLRCNLRRNAGELQLPYFSLPDLHNEQWRHQETKQMYNLNIEVCSCIVGNPPGTVAMGKAALCGFVLGIITPQWYNADVIRFVNRLSVGNIAGENTEWLFNLYTDF